MRSLTTSSSAPPGQEQTEQTPLQFRNLALLYPGKQVLERIRRNGNDNAPLPRYIAPIFDEDDDDGDDDEHSASPLAPNEDIRIIVAQDDAGVSLSRLLFDSHENRPVTSASSQQSPKILTFNRCSSPVENTRSSGFLRHQPAKEARGRMAASQAKAKQDQASTLPPSSQSAFFGQSSHVRRIPAHVSLADGRNEPQVPTENTKEEMDSWLDCVFGKSQMRFKGNNTKLHVLQRQPIDPRLAHWERESQRGGFELCPQRNGPLPTTRPAELVKLRKPTLLVSRTFAVPVHDEDLPDSIRQRAATNTHSTDHKASNSRSKALPKIHCATPVFAVAIVLPLKRAQHSRELTTCPLQLAVDNWRTITRALDALEASVASGIQHQLNLEIATMTGSPGKPLPASLRNLRLRPNALQKSAQVTRISDSVAARIARSFRVLDVSTRSEWNIWRDELRDSSRTEKGLDFSRISFIQLALTAALSSNLSWMRIFALPQLETRLLREARMLEEDHDSPQNRIVVSTTDHNKARQLIYILSKFMPSTQPVEHFARSPPTTKTSGRVSALTQGLKAVGQQSATSSLDDHTPRGPTISVGAPAFVLPALSSPGTSPIKHQITMASSRSPSKSSLQRMKSRIDVQGKGTPAMPIASAPGSSWTTPAVSPDARPSSSASAQENLIRQLQRNNSALSETSTESGSFWNSLRSNSWNWGLRRESGATSLTESGTGMSGSQRGDAPASILKSGKTSFGRGAGKKLVRMVEETEQLSAHHSTGDGRKDSGMPTPTTLQPNSTNPAMAFPQMLEYTYDVDTSVVDVKPLDDNSGAGSCKVPVRGDNFPRSRNADFLISDVSHNSPVNNVTNDRVAGYLDRLHADFALQAVNPYKEFESDVRMSMKGERSPKHGFMATEPHFYPLERWVDVCSTVLIDADTMSVKRLTLRRRVRYSLTAPDGLPATHIPEASANAIRVTTSEEMDSVKRTYRRNDNGTKVDWKDKKVAPSGSESSNASAGTSLTSSCEQVPFGSTDTAFRHSTLQDQVEPRSVDVGSSGTAFKHPTVSKSSLTAESTDTAVSAVKKHDHSIGQRRQGDVAIGDDLTAFIDENAKVNNKPRPQTSIAATRRVPVRNREGKMTGWKELEDDPSAEPGLHDLPATFVNPKREKLKPVMHERTLEEVIDEESLSKPDPSIVSLLEHMLASGDARSTTPSRAGSVHERTRSRSNSNCGSGLAELQFESKKIVKDVLEELITSVATDRHYPSRPSGSFFGFRRGGQTSSEPSVLRQSIAKWLSEG